MDLAQASVRDVGEFALIDLITRRLRAGKDPSPDVLVGPGDDAAVLAIPQGRLAASTDVLVEDVHFRRAWSSAVDVGVKAAAQNCADLVAMGAQPRALLVGLVMPPDLPAAWPLDLADGLRMEAERAGAVVIGGDLSSGPTIVLAVTALGEAPERPVLRSGARPGDIVAVCGSLGGPAAGLALLAAGRTEPRAAVAAHQRPRPEYAWGVRAAGHASAMIDVSDGLLADAGHLADRSDVTLALVREEIGLDPLLIEAAHVLGADPWDWVLAGGEEHAFLATFPARVPEGFRAIGRVQPRGTHAVTVDGLPWSGRIGHRHFGPTPTP